MQALTFGAGIPLLYPIAAVAMLLNTVDTRLKLSFMWPLPRRFRAGCTYTYLQLVKSMTYIHVFIAIWMHSYFRMFGQIAGNQPAFRPASICTHIQPCTQHLTGRSCAALRRQDRDGCIVHG